MNSSTTLFPDFAYQFQRSSNRLRNHISWIATFPSASLTAALADLQSIARFTNDSVAFCRRMLDETGVAATPGVDFDAAEGSHYLRLSFAGSEQDCREAVSRLARWLG